MKALITRNADSNTKFIVLFQDEQGQEVSRHEHISFAVGLENIVSVRDGSTGLGHTPYASIDRSGSLAGMRKNFGWGTDRVVTTLGSHFNMSSLLLEGELDRLSLALQRGGYNPNKLSQGEEINVALA